MLKDSGSLGKVGKWYFHRHYLTTAFFTSLLQLDTDTTAEIQCFFISDEHDNHNYQPEVTPHGGGKVAETDQQQPQEYFTHLYFKPLFFLHFSFIQAF